MSKSIIFKRKITVALLIAFSFLLISSDVFAHANVAPKDSLDAYSGRDYKEGSTVFFEMSISHACYNEDRSQSFNTKHVAAIMPNGIDLTDVAYTEDRQGNRYAGNALMSIKPLLDSDWTEIRPVTGSVMPYYSHGVNNEDVKAIHWMNGDIPNEFIENLVFRASLPKLEGCVETLKVFIPTVQYCQTGKVMAWFREPTPSMSEEVISAGYAPYFNILRDLDANPLPSECGGMGEEVVVYPPVEDLEEGLLHFWKGKSK